MNYQKKLLDLISSLKNRPKLLMHCCCGPCSTTCLELLKDYFDITIFYYNPNIEPEEEYNLRKKEQIRYIKEANLDIKFLDCDYQHDDFVKLSKGLEEEKEGGARCVKCISNRLEVTAKKAQELLAEYNEPEYKENPTFKDIVKDALNLYKFYNPD